MREELLPRMHQRYMGRGKEGKSRLRDELCERFGYNRKLWIPALSAVTSKTSFERNIDFAAVENLSETSPSLSLK
ncbi:MAG: hypothetical protein ACAI35_17755 [Candidatus Methylacidiphilales bacterium]|nr:hypothetical protein [Candidatus Methylacidiphilales bacterium]